MLPLTINIIADKYNCRVDRTGRVFSSCRIVLLVVLVVGRRVPVVPVYQTLPTRPSRSANSGSFGRLSAAGGPGVPPGDDDILRQRVLQMQQR
jgi:hypothetical protein